MSDNVDILLIGCGYMGREYAKVLLALDKKITVVGNSTEGAEEFEHVTGITAISGGIERAFDKLPCMPEYAIVATPIPVLARNVVSLIEHGVKHILVEKPGGNSLDDVRNVSEMATVNGASVYVAYNRRFYASTQKALEIIEEDGGVSSFLFEFTEWSDKIEALESPQSIKENWLLANSSHVIDLAFFLGGHPIEMCSYVSGSLGWHPNGSIYSGAGRSDKDALFSYHANWTAPGRWSVEVLTNKHRLYFKPMEKLQIQELNSIMVTDERIDDELDISFKPGLYKQTEAFLSGCDSRLLDIGSHLNNMLWYQKIAGLVP